MSSTQTADSDLIESVSLGRRLAVTLGVLVAYRLGMRIPLPTIPSDLFSEVAAADPLYPVSGLSILALGIVPFITGYFLVEIASLLIPRLRKIRGMGREGRDRLNMWALRLSLGVALIQSAGIALSLQSISSPGGLPVLTPGPGPRFVTMMSLIAGSAALYLLCRWAGNRGFGNAFCLLLMVDYLWELKNLTTGPAQWPAPYSQAAHWTAAIVGFGAFVVLLRGKAVFTTVSPLATAPVSWEGAGSESDISEASTESREVGSQLRVEQNLPALPQGLIPILWGFKLLTLPQLIQGIRGKSLPEVGGMTYLVALGLSLPLLSWVALQMLSIRPRVSACLPGSTLDDGFEEVLKRRWLQTTVAMTVVTLAFTAFHYQDLWSPLLDIVFLALMAAIGLDLMEEWTFRSRHTATRKLAELDNVHLASRLKALFAQRDIPVLAQAFHYRSLFFFFHPLYKIAVWVPEEHFSEAEQAFEDLQPSVF